MLFCSCYTASTLPRKLLKGLETSEWEDNICTVKYADDLVLLAEEVMVPQGTFDRLVEIGRCYGMEENVEKTMVMLKAAIPI
jgi:hypothetical protein